MRQDFYSLQEFRDRVRVRRLKMLKRKSKAFFRSVRNCFNDEKKYKMLMITLTFRNESVYEESGYAIRDFINLVKMRVKWSGGKIYCYFWVLELQSRGVPHYHIFLVTDKSCYIHNPDDRGWGYGMSNVKILNNKYVTSKYYEKYLSKSEVSKEENFFLKGKRLYTMFVDKAYRDEFFSAVISSYSYFRRMLCLVTSRVVKKVNGFYDLGSVRVKNLVSIDFYDGGVAISYGGILLRVGGVDIVVDDDYECFFKKIKSLI